MKCAIFCADGFEECEALIVVDCLRRANIEIDIISMNEGLNVVSARNITVVADTCFNQIQPEYYDCLILPGGLPGTTHLEENKELEKIILTHHQQNKLLCAICAAPSILGKLNLLQGKEVTCFPTFIQYCYGATLCNQKAVKDGNIITGKGLGAAIEFAALIIESIKDSDAAQAVLNAIQY